VRGGTAVFYGPWEPWEDDILRTARSWKDAAAQLPHRTLIAIGVRGRKLGLRLRPHRSKWEGWEHRIIRAHWPDIDKLCELLPHRTAAAISCRAGVIGMTSERRPWTREDRVRLAAIPRSVPTREIVGLFPGRGCRAIQKQRTRIAPVEGCSPAHSAFELVQAIWTRCVDLGVSRGDLRRRIGDPQALTEAVNVRDGVSPTKLARAVEILGGQLVAVWDD